MNELTTADRIPAVYDGLEITADGIETVEVYRDSGEWWADGRSWGSCPRRAAQRLEAAGYTKA